MAKVAVARGGISEAARSAEPWADQPDEPHLRYSQTAHQDADGVVRTLGLTVRVPRKR